MPEGPECTVHTESLDEACRGRIVTGAHILSGRYQGSGTVPGRGAPPEEWSAFQDALPATISSVSNKAKFIFWTMTSAADGSQLTLWSTLGMTGAWSWIPSEHARICLELDDGERLYYNDQRNFGTITCCMDEAKLAAKLDSLGPSWLPPGNLPFEKFDQLARRQCSKKRSAAVPLAKFLMDQSKTSGIGNYILSESLFLARIYPFAACGDLKESDWLSLHTAICDVIERSYTSQRALAESQAAAAASSQSGGSLSATRGTTWTFELHVFRRRTTADGLTVRQDEGPHKRSVFWVPERQLRGKKDAAD